LKQEDELVKEADPLEWPLEGHVSFQDVEMRYREGLKPSINGLSCEIEAGMRVGIVGMTGAGKSSIL